MTRRLPCLLLLLGAAFPAGATSYFVNSTGDGTAGTDCAGLGPCTLRAALLAANANPGSDFVQFSLLPPNSTIVLESELPQVTSAVILDARPQPGWIGKPTLYIDGRGANNASGLTFLGGAAGSQVLGLGLFGFDGTAIVLQAGADQVTVSGCVLGLASDNSLHGNGSGIAVFSDGNTLGKQRLAGSGFTGAGNTVVGSASDGVFLAGDGNVVYGSVFGGTVAEGNGGAGIRLVGANDNVIGGVEGAATGRNLVASNAGGGIVVGGNGNAVRSNLVGLAGSGLARGNTDAGIQVQGSGNVIGGAMQGEGNTVAYNDVGIRLGSPGSADATEVLGNTIRHNRGTGLRIVAGSGNLVDDNAIDGNGTTAIGDGVRVDSNGNTLTHNRIGLADGNSGEGVYVNGFASGNVLGPGNQVGNNLNGFKVQGGSTQVVGNTVGGPGLGNNGQGIYMVAGSEGSVVQGNSIDGNSGSGLRINADDVVASDNTIGLASPNHGEGVHIATGADGNRVGPGNVIVANLGNGVLVEGAAAEVIGNRVGLDAGGAAAGNGEEGILVKAPATDARVVDNDIGGNGRNGVLAVAAGTRVCGNRVGGDGRGNGWSGVSVEGDGVRVGVVDPGEACGPNQVSHNQRDGVAVHAAFQVQVEGNDIHDNWIAGIALVGETGESLLARNRIHENGSNGIYVSGVAGTGNHASGNEMSGNGVPGMDLAGDGPTANDAGDLDEGPNRMQNTPVIHFAAPIGGTELEVGYSVDSSVGSATFPLQVELFIGTPGPTEETGDSMEGLQLLGTSSYAVAGVHTMVVSMPLPGPGWLTATATDADGNTSEFSAGFSGSLERPEAVFRDGFED